MRLYSYAMFWQNDRPFLLTFWKPGFRKKKSVSKEKEPEKGLSKCRTPYYYSTVWAVHHVMLSNEPEEAQSTIHNNCDIFFSLCVPKLHLWGSPFWVRFLRMWLFIYPTIEVVTFHLLGWCMFWCVFVASIHLSWTWMPGSFEPMWWNACVCRLDLSLYSHPKEILGNGMRTHTSPTHYQ